LKRKLGKIRVGDRSKQIAQAQRLIAEDILPNLAAAGQPKIPSTDDSPGAGKGKNQRCCKPERISRRRFFGLGGLCILERRFRLIVA
jgi:hypothetical protein